MAYTWHEPPSAAPKASPAFLLGLSYCSGPGCSHLPSPSKQILPAHAPTLRPDRSSRGPSPPPESAQRCHGGAGCRLCVESEEYQGTVSLSPACPYQLTLTPGRCPLAITGSEAVRTLGIPTETEEDRSRRRAHPTCDATHQRVPLSESQGAAGPPGTRTWDRSCFKNCSKICIM